jgi:peptidoglycan hydrolase CwlO-like protein
MTKKKNASSLISELKRKTRKAYNSEIQELKGENASLKELVAELSLEVRDLKKNIGSPE